MKLRTYLVSGAVLIVGGVSTLIARQLTLPIQLPGMTATLAPGSFVPTPHPFNYLAFINREQIAPLIIGLTLLSVGIYMFVRIRHRIKTGRVNTRAA